MTSFIKLLLISILVLSAPDIKIPTIRPPVVVKLLLFIISVKRLYRITVEALPSLRLIPRVTSLNPEVVFVPTRI